MKFKHRKKIAFWGGFGLLIGLPVWAATVTSIDFDSTGGTSKIEIQGDAPLDYSSQENAQDKQIVIDLKNAKLGKMASRPLDTSSFDSKVSLISPYPVKGQGNASRIVIQLRDMISPTIAKNGNGIEISVPNGKSVAAADAGSEKSATATEKSDSTNPPAANDSSSSASTASASKASDPTSALENFVNNRDARKFTGKPVTLQVRDADIADVFRLIAEASGFNILLGSNVTGKLTLSMVDVPWDQALDMILRTQKLGAERNNNLLRVVTLADLTNEKQQELAAKVAQEADAPRITRVIPINYANLGDITTTLSKFAQSNDAVANSVTGRQGSNSQLDFVQSDTRTNSVILRDTSENVEKMQKLIAILDTQTPQVLIEGKIVETTERFGKTFGGGLGIFGSGYAVGFNGGNPLQDLFGGVTTNSISSALGSSSSGGTPGLNFGAGQGAMGIQPSLGFLPGIGRLNAFLNLGENENNAKVIASPRSVVLNKENTTITQSTPVLVSQVETTANGPITLQTVQQANLTLNVTPTVTNEGSVLLQLTISRDIPFAVGNQNTAVANRNITTKVLVESGSTLVIGGIYTNSVSHGEEGVPFLRKIPIIGALFGDSIDSTDRNELFFFITPRILNPKEAGLGT